MASECECIAIYFYLLAHRVVPRACTQLTTAKKGDETREYQMVPVSYQQREP